MKTARQRHGASGEDEAVEYLEGMGWQVVVRNLRVGRDEIDVLAVDPGPPAAVVVLEVRSLRTAAFGYPEESVDHAKVGRLYRSLAAIGPVLDAGSGIRSLRRRVDLVVVDRRTGRTQIRHLRALEPP